ncbi:MAG TPA: hypothetical protein PKO30_08955, partial [Prolixibacteraceae bacterium]|nr:hypothetical protein [Prolixibacteraceae bacterium]
SKSQPVKKLKSATAANKINRRFILFYIYNCFQMLSQYRLKKLDFGCVPIASIHKNSKWKQKSKQYIWMTVYLFEKI